MLDSAFDFSGCFVESVSCLEILVSVFYMCHLIDSKLSFESFKSVIWYFSVICLNLSFGHLVFFSVICLICHLSLVFFPI
jgi:hypothetical protein